MQIADEVESNAAQWSHTAPERNAHAGRKFRARIAELAHKGVPLMRRYDHSPSVRAQIMRTRETHPRLRTDEYEAMAKRFRITVNHLKRLRAAHAKLNSLPRSGGRSPALSQEQQREALILILLQRELADDALAARYGCCLTTFQKYKNALLQRPRKGMPQIDLARLLRSIGGANG